MNGQTVPAEIILLFRGILDLLVPVILIWCWQRSVTVGDVRLIALWLFLPSAFRANSAAQTLPHLMVRFPTLLEPSILIPFHATLLPASYSAQCLFPHGKLWFDA